jgi:acyl carrier protein
MSNAQVCSTTLKEVIEVICQIGNVEGLSADQDFYDAGATSVTALPILLEIEDRFQVSIPDEQFIEARTPQALAALITNLKTGLSDGRLHG